VGFENYNTVNDYFQFGKGKPKKSGIHHPARSQRDNRRIVIGPKPPGGDPGFARVSSVKNCKRI